MNLFSTTIMKKIDYKEQLKSPKWQKRRLEIMSRDNFTCQMCGATDKQLHVHHIRYKPGRYIWDYKDDEIITLCEDCHNNEHNIDGVTYDINEMIEVIRDYGFTNTEIRSVLLTLMYHGDLLLQAIANSGFLDKYESNELLRLLNRREQIRGNG